MWVSEPIFVSRQINTRSSSKVLVDRRADLTYTSVVLLGTRFSSVGEGL